MRFSQKLRALIKRKNHLYGPLLSTGRGGLGSKYTVKTDLFYILIIDKKSNKGNFLQICIIAQMIMQAEENIL